MGIKMTDKLTLKFTKDDEIKNGTWCFKGTRLPVKIVYDYLISGWDINEVHKSFPSVSKKEIQELFTLIQILK
jgi:uncharacterized protein (DUF433 family)